MTDLSTKRLSFIQLAHLVLGEEKRPLSADEIWDIANKKGYASRVSTRGKTPAATIGALLYVEIRDKPDTQFYKAEVRPARFFLKDLQSTHGTPLSTDSPAGPIALEELIEMINNKKAS